MLKKNPKLPSSEYAASGSQNSGVEKILLSKIEQAREQVAKGKFLTEEELDKEISSWK